MFHQSRSYDIVAVDFKSLHFGLKFLLCYGKQLLGVKKKKMPVAILMMPCVTLSPTCRRSGCSLVFVCVGLLLSQGHQICRCKFWHGCRAWLSTWRAVGKEEPVPHQINIPVCRSIGPSARRSPDRWAIKQLFPDDPTKLSPPSALSLHAHVSF